jgi:hypothetical protein
MKGSDFLLLSQDGDSTDMDSDSSVSLTVLFFFIWYQLVHTSMKDHWFREIFLAIHVLYVFFSGFGIQI